MSWAIAIALAALSFGVIAFVLKAPRNGWEAVGAALLLGIAGYALQGRPDLPGAPKLAAENAASNAAALVEARKALNGQGGGRGASSNWIVVSDALARHGQYADAAGILIGALEKEPKNSDAWLALGNALVGHAEGTLSPASLYAYRRAAQAAPDEPGPPFFLGLAMAESGRLAEARQMWGDLLARSPADAPWRSDLEGRIARLDAFIAERGRTPPLP